MKNIKTFNDFLLEKKRSSYNIMTYDMDEILSLEKDIKNGKYDDLPLPTIEDMERLIKMRKKHFEELSEKVETKEEKKEDKEETSKDDKEETKDKESEEEKTTGLTDKQKKSLPPALQAAILKRLNKKK